MTLNGWGNFYMIVGSAAGALIGLQFVVVSLIAEFPIRKDAERLGQAFSTPTIIHFAVVLLLAAILDAPWNRAADPSICCALLGFAGIAYQTIVARQMRLQKVYKPAVEDWLFRILVPVVAYGTLAASACAMRFNTARYLFGVAAATLLLLFIGIHNAWDGVTYQAFVRKQRQQESKRNE
jgi:hypothetical protein